MKPPFVRHLKLGLPLLAVAVFLSGCEQLGLETPVQATARMEAEGKAVGSSCRQAGRALEDCYQINPKAPKAAIFAGWREMDAYMRENKIEEVKPIFPMKPPEPKKKKPLTADGEPAPVKEAGKGGGEATAEAPPAKPAEAEVKPSEKTQH